MNIPASTYRIQFNKDFTFKHFEAIIDYLHELGISTVYASPVFKASPGSTHGYDVCDPYSINPEIGTIEELYNINKKLKEKGIGWLQDIVPNHMAFHENNTKLWDVLEKGKASEYVDWFDVNWNHKDADLHGKIMVPFLGDDLENCILNEEIAIVENNRKHYIKYGETLYPCNATSTQKIKNIEEVNSDKKLLRKIIDEQYYLLCKFDETNKRINYRRFFTVNQLICLNMQNDKVFSDYHKLIKQLYDEGVCSGIRIDHIDGLYNPKQYINNLRHLLGENAYIVAEKILEPEEYLPGDWNIQGTSGYEFLSYTSQLITSKAGGEDLLNFYKEISGRNEAYVEVVLNKKQAFLDAYMQGELDNLTELFYGLSLNNNFKRDKTRTAIGLFMVCLPVYRVYPDMEPLNTIALQYIAEAREKAIEKNANLAKEITFIADLFNSNNALSFTQRLMQFTGPLTAKGVEDTTFYVYNPLVAHNEVGDSPGTLGDSTETFNKKMQLRRQQNSLSINATTTHDTKRGEDARVKISLLSQYADEWKTLTQQWVQENKQFQQQENNNLVPSANEAYFIYQNIVGGYPASGDFTDACITRFKEYITKAFREAKENTKHEAPNDAYETAVFSFIDNILKPGSAFLKSFQPFYNKINQAAFILSLTQTVIKLTAPGIPDIYQGAELWDLSYVDPDNRRQVDYSARQELLKTIGSLSENKLEYMREHRASAIEKQYLIKTILEWRKANADLFIHGDYQPIHLKNIAGEFVCYKRSYKNKAVIIAAPLSIHAKSFDSATLQLSHDNVWTNILTEKIISGPSAVVNDLFRDFPVAVLKNF